VLRLASFSAPCDVRLLADEDLLALIALRQRHAFEALVDRHADVA
jgi:hypothetical protein